jgi:hypothetical protein
MLAVLRSQSSWNSALCLSGPIHSYWSENWTPLHEFSPLFMYRWIKSNWIIKCNPIHFDLAIALSWTRLTGRRWSALLTDVSILVLRPARCGGPWGVARGVHCSVLTGKNLIEPSYFDSLKLNSQCSQCKYCLGISRTPPCLKTYLNSPYKI